MLSEHETQKLVDTYGVMKVRLVLDFIQYTKRATTAGASGRNYAYAHHHGFIPIDMFCHILNGGTYIVPYQYVAEVAKFIKQFNLAKLYRPVIGQPIANPTTKHILGIKYSPELKE